MHTRSMLSTAAGDLKNKGNYNTSLYNGKPPDSCEASPAARSRLRKEGCTLVSLVVRLRSAAG